MSQMIPRWLLPVVVIVPLLFLWTGCGKKMTADEMFAKANKFQEERNFKEAVHTYEDITIKYPKSEFAAKAQFMIGFVYANEIKDLEKARKAYNRFLEKYSDLSDSGMVSSARWELANLGKDINEIDILNPGVELQE